MRRIVKNMWGRPTWIVGMLVLMAVDAPPAAANETSEAFVLAAPYAAANALADGAMEATADAESGGVNLQGDCITTVGRECHASGYVDVRGRYVLASHAEYIVIEGILDVTTDVDAYTDSWGTIDPNTVQHRLITWHDSCAFCDGSVESIRWSESPGRITFGAHLVNLDGGMIPPGTLTLGFAIMVSFAYQPGLDYCLNTLNCGQAHVVNFAATLSRLSGIVHGSPPVPTAKIDLSPEVASQTVAPRGTVTYEIVVSNNGSRSDTVQLSKTANAGGWKASLDATRVTLAPGESISIHLTVTAPNKASSFSVVVTGTSGVDGSVQDATATETRIG